MSVLLVFIVDLLLFIVIPFIVWRLCKRAIPLAVLPILMGMILAATGWATEFRLGSSSISSQLGFIGVILLAFTAGLESRPSSDDTVSNSARASRGRLLASALHALLLPFAIGSFAAYAYFNQLPGWSVAQHSPLLAAMAIGLCLAVSALPVLIGIVRELKPQYRSLGKTALQLAVIDDLVLWSGLGLLLIVASGGQVDRWGIGEFTAVAILILLSVAGIKHGAASATLSTPKVWGLALVFLIGGAWSTHELGLHALLGAYFAGVVLPLPLINRLPLERMAWFALFILAPFFFGYSGLRIEADALGLTSLIAAVGLLVLSIVTKVGAVVLFPPSSHFSLRETFAIGSLLQCKGLMEIVAATILHDQGLLSETAYAALVTLAVLSTTLTGPLFHWCFRIKNPQAKADYLPPS